MADKAFMVNRTLCRYAGSYSFVLLAGGIPRETVDPVGHFLEIGRDTTLATSESVTDLAAAFLGYTVKERRELRREMGKWEYVVRNPVRAGLVNRREDWPFQGELNVLRW